MSSLTVVPTPAPRRGPRVGIWTKISVSLIVAGLLALGSAAAIGVRWYYGLERLKTAGSTSAVTIAMKVGHAQTIDELVTIKPGDAPLVDVRQVTVRLGTNTAAATVDVEYCEPGNATPGSYALVGGATCASPIPFHPGPTNLDGGRLLVRVEATKPGVVIVNGISVNYRQGVRHATQQLGPTVKVTVTA